MMTKKEIEAAGREEYALWRKSRDRLNSIKAYMEKNATAHIDRFDKAISSGDPAAMLDVFGPGGGIGGITKAIGKAGPGKAGAEVNNLKKGTAIKDHQFRKEIEEETLNDWSDLRTDKEFMNQYRIINNNKTLSREDKTERLTQWVNKNINEYID